MTEMEEPVKDASKPRPSLRDHFAGSTPQDGPSRWNALWGQKHTPWDRGTHSPALLDLLEEQHALFTSSPASSSRHHRPLALVPGCGRGYDVHLLQAFGYDVYGLDVSEVAHREAVELARGVTFDGDLRPRNEASGAGTAHWVLGDFFSDEWVEQAGLGDAKFDLIFDYTFFCALPPALRHHWAARTSALLAPTGKLICLEFPSNKPPSEQGPPWASPPWVYQAYLAHPGQPPPQLDQHGGPTEEAALRHASTLGDGGLERCYHGKPRRTHPGGMGPDGVVNDFISVWKHPESQPV